MAKQLTKRRKAKKVFTRKLQSAWGACPITDFWTFKDYARMEIDKKEISKTIKSYVRANFKKQKKVMLQAPEWMFISQSHVAATIEWMNLDKLIPQKWNATALLDRFFKELELAGSKRPTVIVKAGCAPPTIAEIIREKTSDFIAAIEEAIDTWSRGEWDSDANFSVYNSLVKVNAPYNMSKAVYEYYKPILDEADELLTTKTEDLVEAYLHMTTKQKREWHTLIKGIVDETERYMSAKKAKRKTHATLPKSADKQIRFLKYLNDSNEHQLVSIDPINIIGAQRLYTFNAKTRILREFVSRSSKGFEIKGSTLQLVDEEASRETLLRKPDEFIPIIMKQTPTKVAAAWKKLSSKSRVVPNTRINKDTLLLKVLDR